MTAGIVLEGSFRGSRSGDTSGPIIEDLYNPNSPPTPEGSVNPPNGREVFAPPTTPDNFQIGAESDEQGSICSESRSSRWKTEARRRRLTNGFQGITLETG